jgi:hypothetical protein
MEKSIEKLRRITADYGGLSTNMRAGTITHVDIQMKTATSSYAT